MQLLLGGGVALRRKCQCGQVKEGQDAGLVQSLGMQPIIPKKSQKILKQYSTGITGITEDGQKVKEEHSPDGS